jgi:hypothetical protein
MDHASFVRVLQRLGHLLRVIEGSLEGKRTRLRLALDQLHLQGAVLNAVQMRDMGMIQRGQHLGFAPEASHALRVAGECVGQDLQRHIALELGVTGAIDLVHATRTQGPRGFRKRRAGCQEGAPPEVRWANYTELVDTRSGSGAQRRPTSRPR